MSVKETLIKYADFFGEIRVDEVNADGTLQNYSIHASIETGILDSKMQDAADIMNNL